MSPVHANAILLDVFGRIRDGVHATVDGLSSEELAFRPDAEANSIGWLMWHLTRVEDDHIAHLAGTDQLWTSRGFYDRFGKPYEPTALGYGQDPAEAGAFRVGSADLLVAYHDAVHEVTTHYVGGLGVADLDRVVEPNWDPPVTLSVRLVSVVADALQHIGQGGYVRGLLQRAGR
ncbi:MAG: mycothiol transferase [Acidimicrobiales bacterium]